MKPEKRPRACSPAIMILLGVYVFVSTGCAGHQQSAVDPGGPQAARIAGLMWLFVSLLTVIFIIVLGLTLWTLTRGHRGIEQEPLETTHLPSAQTENKLTRVVAGGVIATVLILFFLLVSISEFRAKAW
jgi:heme/copper-type cytochrome/quinol oxidase subunit 2